jgi:hypothetical protein
MVSVASLAWHSSLTSASGFAPKYLFHELYMAPCRAAISSYTMRKDIQDKFIASVLQEFCEATLNWTNSGLTASDFHRDTLRKYHTHLARIKTNRSCLCCFMRMPEKVVTCGHALDDSCIKIWGDRPSKENNTFTLSECLLCGVNYKSSTFRFVPPTAGVRALTVDGGGIRGIIPLMFLQHLDITLAWLRTQIKDHFDFVCGTSAGKS